MAEVESSATKAGGGVAGGFTVQVLKATEATKGHSAALDELGGKFGDVAKEALAFGAGLAGLQIGQSVLENLSNAVVDFPEKIQTARITLETFTGSATVAATVLGQIEDLSTTIPFGFEALASTAQRLIALGAPAEQVASQVRDIAAAAAAVGAGDAGLQSIAVALARIQETGIVDARVMRQLTTDQIPAWQILADGMHKTIPELQEMFKHGQITADVFLNLFHEWASTTAGEALAKQSDTITGSLQITTNAMQLLMSEALEPLTARLESAAQAGARFAQSAALKTSADETRTALDLMFTSFDQGVTRAQTDASVWAKALDLVNRQLLEIDKNIPGSQKAESVQLPQIPTSGIAGAFSGAPGGIAEGAVSLLPGVGEVERAANIFETATNVIRRATGQVDYSVGLANASIKTYADSLDEVLTPANAAAASTYDVTKALGYMDPAALKAQTSNDLLRMAIGQLGDTFGIVAAQADVLTAAEDKLNVAAAAKAAEINADQNHLLQMAVGEGGIGIGAIADQAQRLDDAAAKAAKSVGSIGQQALASIPGLAQFDTVMFGTSQQLAAVQLQIAERDLSRLERRPANNLYSQQALLEAQLKVEEIQRQVSFGGALRGIGKVPAATDTKFKTGFASGGSFDVGGSGGTDSQYIGFWATPGENVTVSTPGQFGGGINLSSIFGPGAIVIQTVDQAHAVGAKVGEALAQLVAGANGTQGRAHPQLAGVR